MAKKKAAKKITKEKEVHHDGKVYAKSKVLLAWRGTLFFLIFYLAVMLWRTVNSDPRYSSFVIFPIITLVFIIFLELSLPRKMKIYWRISVVVAVAMLLLILLSMLSFVNIWI